MVKKQRAEGWERKRAIHCPPSSRFSPVNFRNNFTPTHNSLEWSEWDICLNLTYKHFFVNNWSWNIWANYFYNGILHLCCSIIFNFFSLGITTDETIQNLYLILGKILSLYGFALCFLVNLGFVAFHFKRA